MKTLKILALVLAITFSSAMSASTNSIEKTEPETVTSTISKLLKKPNVNFSKDMSAMVVLTVNQDNEIVVLSVDTENKVFEGFIKNRLNYKKISKEAIGDLKKFKIPVTITRSN